MNFQIEEWDKISECFGNMFRGLGEVTTTVDMLQFTSIEPHVATGISLSRQGKIAANMPLHNVDSSFNEVRFDDSLKTMTFIGDEFSYTYRIPAELLAMKSD